MTKDNVLKLRIDYGSVLVRLASAGKTEELRDLYSQIPEDELSSDDWLKIFKDAAEDGELAIRNISDVAIQQKTNMTSANWMGVFAYAALNGDSVVNVVKNILPSKKRREINSDGDYWNKVNFLRGSIIRGRAGHNSFEWINYINQNYPLMTEEDKLSIFWEDSDLALTQYCRSPNISIGQICIVLKSINSKILEVNKLLERRGDEPINSIIVRIPEEIHKEVVNCLENYLSFAATCRYVRDSLKDQEEGIVDILLNGIVQTLRDNRQPADQKREAAGCFSELPPEIVRVVAANLLNPKDSSHG